MKNQQPSFTATLTRGRQYRLLVPNPNDRRETAAIVFTIGEPVAVSSAVKAHLEAKAVQKVETVLAGENVEVRRECQFSFEAITDESLSNT